MDALDKCPKNDRTRELFLGEIWKLPYAFAGASRLDIYAHDEDVRRDVFARLQT